MYLMCCIWRWSCWHHLKGLLDGCRGSHHGSPPRVSSRAMSRASIIFNKRFVKYRCKLSDKNDRNKWVSRISYEDKLIMSAIGMTFWIQSSNMHSQTMDGVVTDCGPCTSKPTDSRALRTSSCVAMSGKPSPVTEISYHDNQVHNLRVTSWLKDWHVVTKCSSQLNA